MVQPGRDGHGSVADDPWRTFEDRLAASLQSLPPDAYLVLEVQASVERGVSGGSGGIAFVQFARERSSLLAEAAGNGHLAGGLRLDAVREAALLAMGWEPPWPGVAHRANWSRRWRGLVPAAAVAAVAVRTLREVYGVVVVAGLQYGRFARDGRALPDPGLGLEAASGPQMAILGSPGPSRPH